MVSPRSQGDLLQGCLYNVWNWSVNWDLPFNPTKCNYIAIGRAPPLQLSLATGSQCNSILVANVVKDLGVLLDNSFSPSIHCKEAASKARRLLLIRRSFVELAVSAALYNTFVRPHLVYAMQACSPNLVADADCLEQIQRLTTRLVKGFRQLPFEERLRRLGLHSSRRLRLGGDLMVTCKMFSGGLDLDPSFFFYSASATWLERLSFQS